jgi:riboflavin kinase / FMN adenylyltransferase
MGGWKISCCPYFSKHMREVKEIENWIAPEQGMAIALGRFDGVHVGHQALIKKVSMESRRSDLIPACFSFREETYPNIVPNDLITTGDEKLGLLRELGVDTVLHASFVPPFTDVSPEEFVSKYLVEKWNAKYVVAGYDFHFGKDRAGDASKLKTLMEAAGVKVEIIEPVKVDGEIVKSTSIRGYIREGNLQKANKFLGRAYEIMQRQVPGQRLGTKIGFPTINFEWPQAKVVIPTGVYAAKIKAGEFDQDANGVAGFGYRPTVQENRPSPILEVHILDSEDMLEALAVPETSERVFTIKFYERIRGEKKFESLEDLKKQISLDCERAREILRGVR